MSEDNDDQERDWKALAGLRAHDLQLRRWKNAVAEARGSRGLSRWRAAWPSAVAAGLVGFLVGWAVFGAKSVPSHDERGWVAENATPELVFTN
jgi:hypothetical protein